MQHLIILEETDQIFLRLYSNRYMIDQSIVSDKSSLHTHSVLAKKSLISILKQYANRAAYAAKITATVIVHDQRLVYENYSAQGDAQSFTTACWQVSLPINKTVYYRYGLLPAHALQFQLLLLNSGIFLTTLLSRTHAALGTKDVMRAMSTHQALDAAKSLVMHDRTVIFAGAIALTI